MSFLIQYRCPKCDFKSADFDNALIDPLDMESLYICSCRICHSLFQRKCSSDGSPINKCTYCGSGNINIYEDMNHITCPNCGEEDIHCECIGTCF